MGSLPADLLWTARVGFQDWRAERRDPRPRVHGLHLYTGLPGGGKTMSMSLACYEAKRQYGDAIRVITDFDWQGQDAAYDSQRSDWRRLLVMVKESDKPTIVALDELGTLVSSRAWQDFPPELFTLVSQRRKLSQGAGVRIIGTVQRLWMTDKNLRELADAIVICRTLWGRLLFQAWYAAGSFDPASGVIRQGEGPFKSRRVRLTPELWSRYDTYKLIERLLPAQDPEARRARTSGRTGREAPALEVVGTAGPAPRGRGR
jgi:hypothetical protein